MRFGITGNTGKKAIWESVQGVVDRFLSEERNFRLDEELAAGPS